MQKRKKIETVGCIGIDRKLFFSWKIIALYIVYFNSGSTVYCQSFTI